MKIIEKIEIHRFRSISDAEFPTGDLVIFSGINNSGKSNILKALNLFFNKQSSFEQKYDFDKDYNKAHTGQAGGKRAIKITLFFSGQGNAALMNPFSISKTFEMGKDDPDTDYYSENQEVQKSIDGKDGNITRQFTRFLNRIQFFYVPAVRDRAFVRSLFLNFEKLIEHNSGDDFKKKMDSLSDVLRENSAEISKDFEKFIGLPTQANLSSKITDILGTVEVNVKTGIRVPRRKKKITELTDVYVDLFSSGDGILMSYLAYFLAHICKKISNKNFIWGFEEPENSLEYSKVQKMADDFNNDFRKNAQIFITTHSPAFVKLKDQSDINFFRVFINPNDQRQNSEIRTLKEIENRQMTLFNLGQVASSEYIKLREELHFVEFAQEIENAVGRICVEEKLLNDSKIKFEKKYSSLLRTHPTKVFVCEDSSIKTIKLWEKWLKMFGLNDINVMSSGGCTTTNIEIWAHEQQKLDSGYKPKIFREIDRDGLTDTQIAKTEEMINNKANKLSYQLKFLPVCEIENFAVMKNRKFNESFWEIHSAKIKEDFEIKASIKTKLLDKTFEFHEFAFRDSDGNHIKVMQQMREDAIKKWKKFLNGKVICKKLQNFNPINFLSSLSKDQLPNELKKFMTELVKFYEK